MKISSIHISTYVCWYILLVEPSFCSLTPFHQSTELKFPYFRRVESDLSVEPNKLKPLPVLMEKILPQRNNHEILDQLELHHQGEERILKRNRGIISAQSSLDGQGTSSNEYLPNSWSTDSRLVKKLKRKESQNVLPHSGLGNSEPIVFDVEESFGPIFRSDRNFGKPDEPSQLKNLNYWIQSQSVPFVHNKMLTESFSPVLENLVNTEHSAFTQDMTVQKRTKDVRKRKRPKIKEADQHDSKSTAASLFKSPKFLGTEITQEEFQFFKDYREIVENFDHRLLAVQNLKVESQSFSDNYVGENKIKIINIDRFIFRIVSTINNTQLELLYKYIKEMAIELYATTLQNCKVKNKYAEFIYETSILMGLRIQAVLNHIRILKYNEQNNPKGISDFLNKIWEIVLRFGLEATAKKINESKTSFIIENLNLRDDFDIKTSLKVISNSFYNSSRNRLKLRAANHLMFMYLSKIVDDDSWNIIKCQVGSVPTVWKLGFPSLVDEATLVFLKNYLVKLSEN
ncbi:expressed protein, partial [Phakopsora pachyrhizi]